MPKTLHTRHFRDIFSGVSYRLKETSGPSKLPLTDNCIAKFPYAIPTVHFVSREAACLGDAGARGVSVL